MGRHPEGFSLVERDGWFSVRFTHKGKRHFIATGKSDRGEAEEEAAQIYADVLSGKRRRVSASSRVRQPLEEIFGEWLASLEGVLDRETIATYENTYVGTHFIPFFKTFERISDEALIYDYGRTRLQQVLRKTMQKELGAIKNFLRWCKMEGLIDALPTWPEYPKTARGQRVGPQRAKANALDELQVARAIGNLPLISPRISRRDRKHFAIRPRFVVAYETALRPATLDALSIPEHWAPGRSSIKVADDIDKVRFGRTLKITEVAQKALEFTARELRIERGLIFGEHDYRVHLRKAGLDDELETKLAAYDLRHARATHQLERGADLSGIAWNHGHTQTTTTAGYAHATRKAGEKALEVGGADLSGAIPDLEEE
jgi:site-specific recombinase XerC